MRKRLMGQFRDAATCGHGVDDICTTCRPYLARRFQEQAKEDERQLWEEIVRKMTHICSTPREPEDMARNLAQWMILSLEIKRK